MSKTLLLFLAVVVIILLGCGASDQSESKADTPEIAGYQDAPAFVENWFYREFSDQATFPDLGLADDASYRDKMVAVAQWVAGFDYVTADDHQYHTTGRTVTDGGGDSSSLAWLTFHAAMDIGLTEVSVELVEYDDGSDLYFCLWRFSGAIYVVDDGRLVTIETFLADDGALVYGFDSTTYWTYK